MEDQHDFGDVAATSLQNSITSTTQSLESRVLLANSLLETEPSSSSGFSSSSSCMSGGSATSEVTTSTPSENSTTSSVEDDDYFSRFMQNNQQLISQLMLPQRRKRRSLAETVEILKQKRKEESPPSDEILDLSNIIMQKTELITINFGQEHKELVEDTERQKKSSPRQNVFCNDDDEKKFTCTICQKKFANKFLLNKHIFIHTGLRPHKCPDCCKSFNRKDNLLRHRKTHALRKSSGSSNSALLSQTDCTDDLVAAMKNGYVQAAELFAKFT
ncbi:unnamed protein product [Auanema sp. JU1783]|nr:unnamed protein product [Auanema sp. JU1783]